MQKKFNIDKIINQHIDVISMIKNHKNEIHEIAKLISNCFKKKGKLIGCGNGGSSSDASHFVAELIGRFKKNRKGFNAINLSADHAVTTAISNDFGYENLFVKQIDSISNNKNDILFIISTSGNSLNIINALKFCKSSGMKSIGILGGNGGKAKKLLNHSIIINSKVTARIQEAHITLIHIICEFYE